MQQDANTDNFFYHDLDPPQPPPPLFFLRSLASFTNPHTLSRAALYSLGNSVAPPASVPDTQALLRNITRWITCSRLPFRDTSVRIQWQVSSCPFPDLILSRRTRDFIGPGRSHKLVQVERHRLSLRLEIKVFKKQGGEKLWLIFFPLNRKTLQRSLKKNGNLTK